MSAHARPLPDPDRNSRTHGQPNALVSERGIAAIAGQAHPEEAYRWAITLGLRIESQLKDREPSGEFLQRVPIGYARQHAILGLVPLGDESQHLQLALGKLASWPCVDVLRRQFQRPVQPIYAPELEIQAAINAAYQQRKGETESIVASLDREELITLEVGDANGEDLLDSSGQPPVIKLVNSMLFEAIKNRASDVHIQPQEKSLLVRQRIDGVLFDALTVPKDFQEEILTRIKVLGKMDIAEKRLPQDGRATVQVGDRTIDLRIASLPTSFGERIVVRFLDKSARLYSLQELGMESSTLSTFQQLIRREHGLILVTGPTGSGKSTTLYAALQEIDSKDLNVLTLEDPIEYQLDGISQTQINHKKGMTFAKGLRNVLRQDPDIIMVGEIRDRETAEMAIQSALTGHLVLSTLHTNDSASAVSRLLDLGIEPFLVASSLVTVVAQRLVRRLCPQCGRTSTLTKTPRGCDRCRQTGYSGRIGLFELMVVNDVIKQLIQQRANASEIRDASVAVGMILLAEDGRNKVAAGLTTEMEILRVAHEA